MEKNCHHSSHLEASIMLMIPYCFARKKVKLGIKLYNIDTVKQLGDIFTKEFTRVTVEYHWKNFMGWEIYSVFSFVVILSRDRIVLVYLHVGARVNPYLNDGL